MNDKYLNWTRDNAHWGTVKVVMWEQDSVDRMIIKSWFDGSPINPYYYSRLRELIHLPEDIITQSELHRYQLANKPSNLTSLLRREVQLSYCSS